jgi:hypothetical protein
MLNIPEKESNLSLGDLSPLSLLRVTFSKIDNSLHDKVLPV